MRAPDPACRPPSAAPAVPTDALRPPSAAAAVPTDALRAIITSIPPRHRAAAREACKAWSDPDATDLLVPAALPPSLSAWAPFACLRCLDLRAAAAGPPPLPPAALVPALAALPSLVALALRETAPGLPLFGAVAAAAAAASPPLLARLRVLRLESTTPPVPAGSELGTAFSAHPAAALALAGQCAELDVAGSEAVWGLVAALAAAWVEAGAEAEAEVDSPPSSPRSGPEDEWEADYGGGRVDTSDEEAGDAAAAAWERGGPRPPPRPPPAHVFPAAAAPPPTHPLPSVRRLSLDLAYPAAPVRSPDTRAGHEPWVGDPACPSADTAADAAVAGGFEARAAAGEVVRAAVGAAGTLMAVVVSLPSLSALSLTCPGGRDRGGLPGFDDWRRGAPAARPSSWRPSVAAASSLAALFRGALGARRLPALTSLTATGWPFGPVCAEPATLACLAVAAPRLESLRLDGGPHPLPELRAWGQREEGAVGGAHHHTPESVPLFGPGAFAALEAVEVGPGLFRATGAAFASAATSGAGRLPSLRRLALSDSPSAAWNPHAAEDDPRLPPTVLACLGGLVVGGRARELRCAARHLKGCWGGGSTPAAKNGLVALDVRAASPDDALTAEELGWLTGGGRALRALALPLGGGGGWQAAFASLSTSAPSLANLTLELWAGAAAAILTPSALGHLLSACPVADLEVAGRMEATAAGEEEGWSGIGAPLAHHHACPACPACPALASALASATATHLRRVCIRRLEVCGQTVAALLDAAPGLTTLVLATASPPLLAPALVSLLQSRSISYVTPQSGPPTIPTPMHHLWWPGVGGGVGKTAVEGMDVRGGAGKGWPAPWLPGAGPPRGVASAGVLWWHTCPVSKGGDPEGEAACVVVPGDADSRAAAAARWWEVPRF